MDFKCNDDSFDGEVNKLKELLERFGNRNLSPFQRLIGLKKFFTSIRNDSYGENTNTFY